MLEFFLGMLCFFIFSFTLDLIGLLFFSDDIEKPSCKTIEIEIELKTWIKEQRRKKEAGELSEDEIMRLNLTPLWGWTEEEEEFKRKRFLAENYLLSKASVCIGCKKTIYE